WEKVGRNSQPPNGVVANVARDGWKRNGRNRVAVGERFLDDHPGVARSSQPWAFGRNPVGIPGRRPRTIPKGLRPPAQGWRATPTLGARSEMKTTPTALRLM